MAEQSYPILEQPLTDKQWKSVTLGIGNGVLDEGGGPYTISLSNTNDTATIGVDKNTKYAHAIVSGFYHKIDSPMQLRIPPVSSVTKYTIGLCYDPLNASSPVTLKVVTGLLDYSNDKQWVVLHEITRRPNTVLTESEVVTLKPSIAPRINCNSFAALPSPEYTIVGTTAFTSSDSATWRLSGEGGAKVWRRIAGDYYTSASAMPNWSFRSSFPGNIHVQPGHNENLCTIAGQLIHLGADTPISALNWSKLGNIIPAALRTSRAMDIHVPAVYQHGSDGIKTCIIRLDFLTGDISIIPENKSELTIRTGCAISFQASWAVPRTPISW